jgi:hypothetical protein
MESFKENRRCGEAFGDGYPDIGSMISRTSHGPVEMAAKIIHSPFQLNKASPGQNKVLATALRAILGVKKPRSGVDHDVKGYL